MDLAQVAVVLLGRHILDGTSPTTTLALAQLYPGIGDPFQSRSRDPKRDPGTADPELSPTSAQRQTRQKRLPM